MQPQLSLLESIRRYPDSITDVDSFYTFIGWFLKESYEVFHPREKLVFANVHFFPFSIPNNSQTKNLLLPGIPTVLRESTDIAHSSEDMLKEVLAFLLSLSVLDTPSREGVEIAMRVFRGKFIIETIRMSPGKQDVNPLSFDPYVNILTMHFPDYYDPAIPREFFGDLTGQIRGCLRERFGENGILLDGEGFIELISEIGKSPGTCRFFQKVHEFLGRREIQKLVENYTGLFSSGMRQANWRFNRSMIEHFVKSMFLHSWLKSIPYTTIMPVVHDNADDSPAMAVFLINTENRLRLETINTLHLALSQAIVKLHGSSEQFSEPEEGAISRGEGKEVSHETKRKSKGKILVSRDGSWRRHFFHGMVGKSREMREVFEKIRTVARFDTDVLILGESGTGKEEVARIIHERSSRKDALLLPVCLASRTDTLVESELFGYEKGAFTGAYEQRKGYFEQAHGGTIFLDELSHIPPATQSKLLRVLQTRKIQRVGGSELIPVDVKVLSASHEDLTDPQLRADIHFLDPLYYRLQNYVITLPPLRSHKSDIPLLVDYFLSNLETNRRKQMRLSRMAMDCLMDYHWPGNVRQLMGLLNQAFINAYDEGEIRPEHFEFEAFGTTSEDLTDLDPTLSTALTVLREARFHIGDAMRHLEEKASFHPNRKTMMRYCRELCLWTLAQKQWDLQMAIRLLAGREDLEEQAARKFRDYFLGDKSTNGMLTILGDNPGKDFEKVLPPSLVRKKHLPLLQGFIQQYRAGRITVEKWRYILNRYLFPGQRFHRNG